MFMKICVVKLADDIWRHNPALSRPACGGKVRGAKIAILGYTEVVDNRIHRRAAYALVGQAYHLIK
jgi:hypothetical protein